MTRNALLLLAGALAVGLIAAGCGGDDDDDADTLTRQEFIARGNAVCKQGNAEINAAADETFQGGQPSAAEQDAFVTDTLVPSVQGQIDDIRALGIPEEDADQVNGILDDAEGVLEELEADPALLQQGDPFAPINAELRDYGLTTCAG